MMRLSKYLTACLFLLGCVRFLSAQETAPVLRWQHSFGGNKADFVSIPTGVNIAEPYKILLRDRDGGYLVAANTATDRDGDVTGGNFDSNYSVWIIKFDSAFNIVWNKIYGGRNNDMIHAVRSTPDGGYIFVANSDSYDGQLTFNHGFNDSWVVKLDRDGNIQWQRSYGGTGNESSNDIILLSDGYIICGSSASNDYDVSGNHDASNIFTGDLWVLRIDLTGNIIWSKCYGKTGTSETGGSIRQTSDGGFIIAGNASSDGGDVAGVHGNNGQPDIWLLKISASGTLQWQKCIGGTRFEGIPHLEITPDGGYILSTSTSSFDGDVSGWHGGPGDAWLVKTDALGNLQWQKCFGGSGPDGFNDLVITPDGGYVAVGFTGSKDGDITSWFGQYDYSIAKFSSAGELLWQNSFGAWGPYGGNSFAYGVLPTADNEYIIVGNTEGNQGEVTGNHGVEDIWIVRAGSTNTIKGNVFIDANSNGVRDAGETGYNKVSITGQQGTDSYTTTPDPSGAFHFAVGTGSVITTASPYSSYFNVVPSSKTTVFSGFFNTDSFDIALQPIQVAKDVSVSLFSATPARFGSALNYQIYYANTGTAPLSGGAIKIIKPSILSLNDAVPSPASSKVDTIVWNFGNLAPGQTGTIQVNFDNAANLSDVLQTTVQILPAETVLNLFDDTAFLKQVVIGPYDPNDKQESNGGVISPDYISQGKALHYMIRFQNTGTDTAFNVLVTDTLDAKLDWASLQTIATSHPYNLQVKNGNQLSWSFPAIHLPDSNINEPASHGYIAYSVKPKNTVAPGDIIHNAAGIFFDYNLPVATNIQQTQVMATLPLQLLSFDGRLQSGAVTLSWTTAHEEHNRLFEIERSTNALSFIKTGQVIPLNALAGARYTFIDPSPLPGNNYYRLKMIDDDGKYHYSNVIVIMLRRPAGLSLSVYPNPSRDRIISVNLQGVLNSDCWLRVADVTGRVLLAKNLGAVRADSYSCTLSLADLPAGHYVIVADAGGKMASKEVLLQ